MSRIVHLQKGLTIGQTTHHEAELRDATLGDVLEAEFHASTDTPLLSLKTEPLIFCHAGATEKEVAETFDKYNLLTLPVVDETGNSVIEIFANRLRG